MLTRSAAAQLPNTKRTLTMDRFRLLGSHVPLVESAARGHLFAVVDGVGGAPRGGEAAGAVVDALTSFFRPETSPSRGALASLLRGVDRAIKAWGDVQGTSRPLGAAAATVAWLEPSGDLHLFHAGDTRALLLDGGQHGRLTEEHGGVGRNLRNYFGLGAVCISYRAMKVEEGATLVLVTDGVTKVMDDAAIASGALAGGAGVDAERAAQEVVRRARGRRSVDDITCVIVDIEELDG